MEPKLGLKRWSIQLVRLSSTDWRAGTLPSYATSPGKTRGGYPFDSLTKWRDDAVRSAACQEKGVQTRDVLTVVLTRDDFNEHSRHLKIHLGKLNLVPAPANEPVDR